MVAERSALVGIFVGGHSRRMGGRPKGLLPSPEGGLPIVEQLVQQARSVQLEPVIVGKSEAYAHVASGVPRLVDEPEGAGPLGGLRALLRFAGPRPAIAIACDMPFLSSQCLDALASAPGSPAVLSLRVTKDAPWEPLFARYDGTRVAPVLDRCLGEGVSSFQRLFAKLLKEGQEVAELRPTQALLQCLRDWDSPEDML
jgi:molybdopterin-guanine dinucleotide biosynthesis protein A